MCVTNALGLESRVRVSGVELQYQYSRGFVGPSVTIRVSKATLQLELGLVGRIIVQIRVSKPYYSTRSTLTRRMRSEDAINHGTRCFYCVTTNICLLLTQ